MEWTTADFESLCWHDNHVHGMAFREGPPGEAKLVLDIDHITQWLCGVGDDRRYRFMVAPAELVFDDVLFLEVRIDGRGFGAGLLSIDEIRRERLEDARASRVYRWAIELNCPPGELTFLASGFRQRLRAAPIESEGQSLSWDERQRLESGGPAG